MVQTPRSARRPLPICGIEEDLRGVEAVLAEQFHHTSPALNQLLEHSALLGGKRLRPILVLLSADAVGQTNTRHHRLAAVLEMIHIATLVHDDVLDGADMRRHHQTLHRLSGVHHSVLLGDYLFSKAFWLSSTLGDAEICSAIGLATTAVCEGEIRQSAEQGNYELSWEEYFDIVTMKTAALCACAAELGARVADADALTQQAMHDYGLWLGRAFQIVDDVLDVCGSDEQTGKTLGTDLKNHKATLPLILALQQSSALERSRWQHRLANDQASAVEIRRWLEQVGAIDQARERARWCIGNAVESLNSAVLEQKRGGLLQLTEFVLARDA